MALSVGAVFVWQVTPVSVWSKAIAIVVACALLFEGRVVYLAAYSLLAFYFGFRYWTRHATGRLRAVRTGRRLRLFPGERTTLQLKIESDSPFPLLWALVEEGVDQNLRAEGGESRFGISLGARGRCTLEYPIEARQRGAYKVGPLRLVTGDPLGFEQVQVEVAGEAEILVYPRIYPLDALGLGGSALSGPIQSRTRRLEDPTRVAGIRDYVYGESIRHVHWKATAHTHSFKVKTFEATNHDDIAVILDLAKGRYRSWNVTHMSELAIEVTASLLAEAAQRRQAFGFYMLGRLAKGGLGNPVLGERALGDQVLGRQAGGGLVASGVRKGDAHLGQCLEMLARAEPVDDSLSLASALEHVAGRTSKMTTLYVVTPCLDPAARTALVRVKNTGHRPYVVEVSDEPADPPAPLGVGYARVGYRGDIARSLAGRHPSGAIIHHSTA